MTSEQHKAGIQRPSAERHQMGTSAAPAAPAAPTAGNGAVHEGGGRGNQDARRARIAAHVAEEAAMLRRRS